MQISSFARNLFELLQYEESSNIYQILSTVCNFPILPVCGLIYKLPLSKGIASLKFSLTEQIEDIDVALSSISLLNANMMVLVWEALLLERKVVVVSTTCSLVSLCCEFLRKLVLPFPLVNTFVPLLPESLLNTIEAPFPYLVGADSEILRRSQVDTSDSVVVDLDSCCVYEPKNGNPQCGASAALKNRMISEITDILRSPIQEWVTRSSRCTNDVPPYPLSPRALLTCVTNIQQAFIRVNLSLMSARTCHIRAFFRHPQAMEMLSTKPISNGRGLRTSKANKSFLENSKVIHIFICCIFYISHYIFYCSKLCYLLMIILSPFI